jgi:diamine N-acetyltransferase
VIELRLTTPDELGFVVRAEQAPDNRPFVIPWSRDQHAAAVSEPDLRHLVLHHVDLGLVGFVILAGLESPHASIEFRRLVVTVKRRGIGRTAVRLVQAVAFDEHRAHRLWLDVKVHNRAARVLYESEGFVVEGILRDCLRHADGFDSLVVMSMLRPEYERRRQLRE